MVRFGRFVLLSFGLTLLGMLVILPVLAQEGGQGGIIIEPNSNAGSDVATLNPILGNDVYSSRVYQLMFTTLLGIDPEKGVFAPGARNGLAKDWSYSEDGKTITYTLRDDMQWSDGTPVTAQDWIYAYNAVASGETSSPRGYAAAVIDKVEAPVPHTLVVTYKSAACNNLDNTNAIYPVPSHIFQEQVGEDYAKINEMDFNKNPVVSNGVFSFTRLSPGEQVSLSANQSYADTLLGYVNPTGFIYKNVPDVNVALEQFLAGEVNLMSESVPPQSFPDLRARGQSGEIKVFEQLDNGYEWLAFNLADPKNPQNGLDESGNPVDQGHHPIFGDPRVRRALAMAVDMDAIIQGAFFGDAVRTTSPAIATSWAYNPDLQPIPFDLEAAKAMLAEAGWTDENGDGTLEAHGAMFAPDGTPLQFELMTSAGDKAVEAVAQLLAEQISKVGAKVDLQIIDFNVAVEKLLGQTFDTVMLGWRLSYPDDPSFAFAFNPENDQVGGGFNFVSYNNPEVADLLKQADSLPGCDPQERAALYHQAQAKLVEDQPYIFLYTQKRLFIASGNMEGYAPYPNYDIWNIDSWALK